MQSLRERFLEAENRVHAVLVRSSVAALRISVGLVFFAFGILKYFPGVSPAQNLVETTTHILLLGLIPGNVALILTATLECTIGLLLMSGRGLRVAFYLLIGELLGILSPIVLLPGRLFAGPYDAPTLEGQYVLKDITLVAAAMVVAAASFRGGRLIREEPVVSSGLSTPTTASTISAQGKLAVVLRPLSTGQSVDGICRQHRISPATYHRWRDQAMHAATDALTESPRHRAVSKPSPHARGGMAARSALAVAVVALFTGGVLSLVTNASAASASGPPPAVNAAPSPPSSTPTTVTNPPISPQTSPPTTPAPPAPMMAATAPTGPAPGPITYTVAPGDTLSSIAWWFHSHGYDALYEANKATLGDNPNLIHPGQQITLSNGTMTLG